MPLNHIFCIIVCSLKMDAYKSHIFFIIVCSSKMDAFKPHIFCINAAFNTFLIIVTLASEIMIFKKKTGLSSNEQRIRKGDYTTGLLKYPYPNTPPLIVLIFVLTYVLLLEIFPVRMTPPKCTSSFATSTLYENLKKFVDHSTRDTMMKWLYPTYKSFDDVFQKYNTVPGEGCNKCRYSKISLMN